MQDQEVPEQEDVDFSCNGKFSTNQLLAELKRSLIDTACFRIIALSNDLCGNWP